ncbi:MAG: hypothetical protein Q8R02_20575 [Hyphomonadaceae bacterium]|nr:hypothetical protein [Hyphomonadaceae bacterium]
MGEVDRLNRLLLEVRSTLLDKSQRSKPSAGRATGKSDAPPPRSDLAPFEMRQGLVESLRALGPITQQSRRQARKHFVHWVVLGEFGFELANDPGFAEICDKVLHAFAEDAELSVRLDDLLTSLTGKH